MTCRYKKGSRKGGKNRLLEDLPAVLKTAQSIAKKGCIANG